MADKFITIHTGKTFIYILDVPPEEDSQFINGLLLTYLKTTKEEKIYGQNLTVLMTYADT